MQETEIILTGSFGVGKSSLFNRIIYNDFSDKYHSTIGVRINDTEITYQNAKRKIKLWDIAGEVSQSKVPTSYFLKKDIILFVIDLNRSLTFKHLSKELVYLRNLCPHSKVKVIGNKIDLVDKEQISQINKSFIPHQIDLVVSAKTEENMELFFPSILA